MILTNIKIKSPLELCNACNKDFAKVLFALYMDFTLGLLFIDYIATIYESSGNMIAILCIINFLWGLAFFGGLVAYAFLKRNAIKSYVREVHQKSNPYDTPSELTIEIIEKDWRCRKCGMEQLAYGRLEPALNRSFGNWNIGRISIKVNVISFVISVIFLILMLTNPNSTGEFFGLLLIYSATIFVSSVIITIESKLKKKPDFIKKSEERLQNKDYVTLLRKHGYEVPHSIRSSK